MTIYQDTWHGLSGAVMNEHMIDMDDVRTLQRVQYELEMMRWEMKKYGYPLWHTYDPYPNRLQKPYDGIEGTSDAQ